VNREEDDLVGTIIEALQEDQLNSKMVVDDQEEDVLWCLLNKLDLEPIEEDRILKMKVC
jgi:hypothetical protein